MELTPVGKTDVVGSVFPDGGLFDGVGFARFQRHEKGHVSQQLGIGPVGDETGRDLLQALARLGVGENFGLEAIGDQRDDGKVRLVLVLGDDGEGFRIDIDLVGQEIPIDIILVRGFVTGAAGIVDDEKQIRLEIQNPPDVDRIFLPVRLTPRAKSYFGVDSQDASMGCP